MAITQLPPSPELTKEQADLRARFFEASGYGPSDLLSLNYETGIFLTLNGGTYRMEGSSIEWISGPSPSVEERDQWDL